MGKRVDLMGRKFGKLTVVAFAGRWGERSESMWSCQCECGELAAALSSDLQHHALRSCGCVRRKKSQFALTHGLSGTNIARIYHHIVARCSNPNRPQYRLYGGRGIKMCDRWRNGENGVPGLKCFVDDVGPRPTPAHTLDRIDVNGHYEPGNVRWATRLEQGRNRRDTKRVLLHGQVRPLYELAEEYGLPHKVLVKRIDAGWNTWRALTTPVRQRHERKIFEDDSRIINATS